MTTMCHLCSQTYDNATDRAHACAPSDVAETQAVRMDVLTGELEEARERLKVIENALRISDAKPSVIEEEDDGECWHVGAVNNVFDLLVDGESGTVFATTDTGEMCRITIEYENGAKA